VFLASINKRLIIFAISFALLFIYACNPTKKLKENERLLIKTRIIDKDTKLDQSEIESYIKQKPNKKIFGMLRFHLWLFNLANETKVKQKRIALNNKQDKKNAKRIKKGKKEKKYNRQLMGEWLLSIGEAPVIYDSTLAKKTSKQIHLFLGNKGFYENTVQDTVIYKKGKRAKVYYTISASTPYTINNIYYKSADETAKYYLFSDTAKTLLKKGDRYDVDVLQKERNRITNQLNNLGFFLFSKDYIYYEIDSSVGNRKVNITLGIKKYAQKFSDQSDSIVETNHTRFYISNIYIQPDFVSKKVQDSLRNYGLMDTINIDNYNIIYSKKLKFKNRVLLNAIFFHKGDLYQLKNSEDTYKRLAELKEFKTINISYTRKSYDSLDCKIQLSTVAKQSFTIETEGTNTSGNLGISGSFTYQNRNLFKGAELLEFKIRGGIQAQPTFNGNSATQIGNLSNATQTFNTIEFGPEFNIYIPRFLLPFKVKPSKNSNPKTIFTSALTYQSRPDYTRTITNLSFAYTWKETSKKRHTITPLMANYVKVDLQPYFLDYLTNNIKNLYIINSFSNHVSTSTRYTFNYNEQTNNKTENFAYFKLNFESSGNILRGAYNLINDIKPNTFKKDQYGRYELLGIVYSQYLRMDADFRYYLNKNEINKIVFRIAGGFGRALENFPALPFERSFFSGGANGIRAWQARTLGPGSYSDDGNFSFDQFGDMQLEANVEYRFKLLKKLNGALFVDIGNTWLRKAESSRPGGNFELNRFYKEIAIGSGTGIRADFSFFIIRFDIGTKVYDPQFDENKRWVLGKMFDTEWKNNYKQEHNNNKYTFNTFNIGIGYPF